MNVLACPHCGAELSDEPGGVGCVAGHRFDRAKQGHLTLLGPRARLDTADSVDMVEARAQFLAAGHYRPIADAVTAAVLADPLTRSELASPAGSGVSPLTRSERASPAGSGGNPDRPVVVEIGAGIGWYLGRLLADLGSGTGIALDSSKPAAKRAAKVPGVLSIVADAWSALPLLDGSVDIVSSIFAPRDGAEVVRVLRPGGLFVAVTPLPEHLLELREVLAMLTVDEGKADRLAASLPEELTEVGRDETRFPLQLDRAAAAALVRMGPAARHLSPEQIAGRAAALPESAVATAAVTVQVFRRA